MSSTEKTPNLIDGMKEQAIMAMIQSFLPKIVVFIKPMMEKVKNYLSNKIETPDKKLASRKILIEERNSKLVVMILDNTKDWELINTPSKNTKSFSGENGAIEHVFDIDQFIPFVMSGNFESMSKHFESKFKKQD